MKSFVEKDRTEGFKKEKATAQNDLNLKQTDRQTDRHRIKGNFGIFVLLAGELELKLET